MHVHACTHLHIGNMHVHAHTGTLTHTHHTCACVCLTHLHVIYMHVYTPLHTHVHARVCIVCMHNTGTCKICAMLPNFIRGHYKTHVSVSVCVYVRAHQQRWTHPPSPSSAAPALFLGSHVSLREHVKCPMHLWGLPISAPTTCRCGLISPKARVR